MDKQGIELIKELAEASQFEYLKESALSYLATQEREKVNKSEAWNNILGNEYLKRAIEVSLAGQHPITVIGNPDNGRKYLEIILGDLLMFIPPCKCYHFTDPLHACICGVSELNKYRNSKKYKKAMTNEILVQLFPPTKHDLSSQNNQETFAEIVKRIKNISSITPIFKQSDLLNIAISKIGFSLIVIESIKNVAATIARLDNSSEVKDFHVAEAIQYQNLNNF